MAIGSAPVTDWKAKFNRKQGEDETAMDCWERIKTAATALASADRAMPHALIVDTLKEALSSSHTHWVVDIEDDATFEQIDALIIKKGTVQQVGLAYGPIRACSYSYTAQAAGPQRSPRKASLTPGSADAMRGKSMFAAYIAASVGHS